MAFGLGTDTKSSQDEKNQSVVTEKDLLRQLASNMTKQQIISQKKDKINEDIAGSAKQLMLDNFNVCN